jgi:hypothetical protein
MDDLCLSIRTFRRYSREANNEINERDNVQRSEMLETAENNVINELTETIKKQMPEGLGTDRVKNARRTAANSFGGMPIARTGHFVYGILDLIQQHAKTIDLGKLNDKIVHLSEFVAKNSQYTFLRRKAFELLEEMSNRSTVGGKMPKDIVQSFLHDPKYPPEMRQKANNDWISMRERALDLEKFHARSDTDPHELPNMDYARVSLVLSIANLN